MNYDILDVVYVTKGFWAVATDGAVVAAAKQVGGEIEVAQYLIDMCANLTWAHETLPETDECWAYAVAEPFGNWIAEELARTGELPTHEQARAYLTKELK